MKKHKKILLIVSVAAILIGSAMVAGSLYTLWDTASRKISTMEFTENTHIITDEFTKIRISTINSSIEILPSADGICRIICEDSEKLYHRFSVTESEIGVQLNIDQYDDWEWFDMLYDLYGAEDITLRIYLPEAEYALMHVNSASGDITIAPDFCFRTLNTYTESGNTKITTLRAENLMINSLSGDLMLRDLEVMENTYLESISGLMQIENLKAPTITTHASSGSAFLEHLSSDYLRATSTSGDIRVFHGDFREISYFETGSGSIEIVDSACGEQMLQGVSGAVTLQNVTGSSLNASTSSGDISLWDTLYSGNMLCHTISGEIMLSAVDAKNLELITSSGEVSGNLLSGKNFITETSSGYVQIPPSDETAGTCHIQTVSGNISIAIEP